MNIHWKLCRQTLCCAVTHCDKQNVLQSKESRLIVTDSILCRLMILLSKLSSSILWLFLLQLRYSACFWHVHLCIIQKLLTFPLKLRFIFRSFQRWKIDFNLCFLIQPHWHTHTPHDTTCSLLATNPRLHHLISYLRCHSSQIMCSPHRIYDARCVLFPNLTSHLAEKVSDKWYRCLH